MGWWCNGNWKGRGHGRAACGGEDDERHEIGDRALLAIALDILRGKPGTGYDVVRGLEERLDGIYAVGPGAVYPALRLAEDAGFVKAEAQEGRTSHALTEAGEAYLAERREALDGFWRRIEATRYRQEVWDLVREAKRLAWTVREEAGGRTLEKERLTKIREALEAARKAIHDDLAG